MNDTCFSNLPGKKKSSEFNRAIYFPVARPRAELPAMTPPRFCENTSNLIRGSEKFAMTSGVPSRDPSSVTTISKSWKDCSRMPRIRLANKGYMIVRWHHDRNTRNYGSKRLYSFLYFFNQIGIRAFQCDRLSLFFLRLTQRARKQRMRKAFPVSYSTSKLAEKRRDSSPLIPKYRLLPSINFQPSSHRAQFSQSAGLIRGTAKALPTLNKQSWAAQASVLFPMVRTAVEVEQLLSLVDGRLPCGIMIETGEILNCIPDISRMPLSRVYVGLNDLMISRGARNSIRADD